MNREEKKALLFKVGKKLFNPLKHVEFECPVCGGIATVSMEESYTVVECHACGTRRAERE